MRWIEFLKDYDVVIDFHPEKANVVANSLSRKTIAALRALDARLSVNDDDGALCAELTLWPSWIDRIKELQVRDEECLKKLQQVKDGELTDYMIKADGNLYYRGRLEVEEKVHVIQNNLKAVADRQIIYRPGKERN
ncbi:uncharacterized protein LOC120163185 [Hibiscus syriacus]|uniref:uncharacterized protein LOC120163185 n=1 Tax=Hibiscus syriacus TaxID=106335 RepID=UPI001921152D|nr:uncharacterized protein LOC120163185 [Hibiscus syriacus]